MLRCWQRIPTSLPSQRSSPHCSLPEMLMRSKFVWWTRPTIPTLGRDYFIFGTRPRVSSHCRVHYTVLCKNSIASICPRSSASTLDINLLTLQVTSLSSTRALGEQVLRLVAVQRLRSNDTTCRYGCTYIQRCRTHANSYSEALQRIAHLRQ